MDPRTSAQDLLVCDLCQTAALQSHCELCQINLCKACVGEHLSDSSVRHIVVPYKHRKTTPSVNYPKCPNHTQKHCEVYCEKCDIPACSICISNKHDGHYISDVLKKLNSKTKSLKRDFKELEQRIYPTYKEIESDLLSEKLNLEAQYETLITAVTEHGEFWHREINGIVNKQKFEINQMKTRHLTVLNKQGNDMKKITSEVEDTMLGLKKILDSNDVLASAYISRNAEFINLPPKVKFSLPIFSPYHENKEQLHQMFGSLSALSMTTEEHGYIMKTPEAASCPPVKPLIDEPELIITIDTGYSELYSVTCLSDEEIWTSGDDKIMKLYNLQGKLLKSIKTKSGNIPCDIAVTRSGDLVYTDEDTRTVNIVKNKQIQEVIRLNGWKPYYLCSTSSGDLLVTMLSDDETQSKVVRYSGSTEKQTIQFDSEGEPFYSPDYFKYITENRNHDICVADCKASAVIVVNQEGVLRFKYTGHPSISKESFDPLGITTDSRSQILTAEHYNRCIHILNQDGQFLRFIFSCDVGDLCGLCMDTADNLIVTEVDSGKVKKIKYM